MIAKMISLNGKAKKCSCGSEEYDIEKFETESVGKKYRQLVIKATCHECGEPNKVRVGKIKELVRI